MYLNCQFAPLDNLSFRGEFYNDMEASARRRPRRDYVDFGVGWQHWLSPQVELRPEITFYSSLDADAFNGNSNASPVILPTETMPSSGRRT